MTQRLAGVAEELLVVETHMDARDDPRPAMVMYPGDELAGDPTNWRGPNRACMEGILRNVGFGRVTFRPGADAARGVFHAWKSQPAIAAAPRGPGPARRATPVSGPAARLAAGAAGR